MHMSLAGSLLRKGAALAAMALAAMAPISLSAETFRFGYSAGDRYRILSTVNEDVYINRALSHRSEILNRIAVEISAEDARGGTHKATFQTSERSVGVRGSSFQWAREYESVFVRDAYGRYTIAPEYWMPVVRDVPVFPDKDLRVGDAWTAPGEEVHDFRDSFGIAEPYRIPVNASYKFIGERTPAFQVPEDKKRLSFPAFTVAYRIFDEPPRPAGTAEVWPTRIMGASDQIVYWDREAARPIAYEEKFRMIFELSNGTTFEFRGTANAVIVESQPMDKKKLAADIAADIAKMAIPDAAVKISDEGVAINLEDIQFQPDSAILLPSERSKLDRIAEILKKHPERDILVAGHTALAGTEAGRMKLSQERAAAVAEYLISVGARAADRVVVRGFGATKPVAGNDTEAGRKKNRRVEIVLLEN